jgi:prevent-host-death family protein
MLDIGRDIESLSSFKRNTSQFVRQLRQTGEPVVLTINGKAALVVQDAQSYQKLLEQVERPASERGAQHGNRPEGAES